MLLASGYFDESSDGEFEDRVFTIGGYIGGGPSSLQLDLRWQGLLDKYGLAYFKASELENGIGEFAKFRDRPATASIDRFTEREKDLLKNIKIEFVDLLCKQRDIVAISATIHMRHLKAFERDHPELFKRLPPFYQLCGHLVMMESGLTVREANETSPPYLRSVLRPIFDSHQEFGPRFKASFEDYKQKNPKSSQYLLPPEFEDEQTYKCLQAADLFVYEVRRTVSNHFFEPRIKLRIAMGRLFSQVRATYVLDYGTLKSLALSQDRNGQIPIKSIEDSYKTDVGLG
jgi:Protein of unknown function (DUF3800)